jgi:hypothetical protein
MVFYLFFLFLINFTIKIIKNIIAIRKEIYANNSSSKKLKINPKITNIKNGNKNFGIIFLKIKYKIIPTHKIVPVIINPGISTDDVSNI